jgi:hypothetical protein
MASLGAAPAFKGARKDHAVLAPLFAAPAVYRAVHLSASRCFCRPGSARDAPVTTGQPRSAQRIPAGGLFLAIGCRAARTEFVETDHPGKQAEQRQIENQTEQAEQYRHDTTPHMQTAIAAWTTE